MFTLKKPGRYIWPVAFKIPGENGSLQEFTFTAEFRHLPQTDLDSMWKKVFATPAEISDEEVVKKVLIGWKDVQDENGAVVPFNDDTLQSMLDFPRARSALVQAYFDSLAGKAEKN